MTDRILRLYAAGGALAAFVVAGAGIAARPWVAPPRDPRLVALDRREQRLVRDARLVQQIVDGRRRAAAAAPPPAVRVVTLPPVATTRSS